MVVILVVIILLIPKKVKRISVQMRQVVLT